MGACSRFAGKKNTVRSSTPLGVTVFDDRKYYLISLLIIACTLVPFAVAFERRRLSSLNLQVFLYDVPLYF